MAVSGGFSRETRFVCIFGKLTVMVGLEARLTFVEGQESIHAEDDRGGNMQNVECAIGSTAGMKQTKAMSLRVETMRR